MPDTEEPPAKMPKTNEDDDDLTDTLTDSNLTDASVIPESLDLPETSLPEVSDMPEVADLPAIAEESLEMAENNSMEGAEMTEECLQDSFDSQEVEGLTLIGQEAGGPASLDSLDSQGADGQEMESQEAESQAESQEGQEGQEEWLSEGVLTDDDFNPVMEPAPESQTSQTAFTTSLEEQTNVNPIPNAVEVKAEEQNIEDALNTLEGGPEKDGMPDLEDFLIKKTDEKTDEIKAKTEVKSDDGNDTDDLLRMLGDDGSKTKKMTKTVKDVRSAARPDHSTDDDDDFVFEGAAKKLKLTKSSKIPPKAVPEDMDGSDQTSDEASTVQKMFASKKSNQKSSKPKAKPIRYQETKAKSIVSVVERPKKEKLATSTPLHTNRARSLLKPSRASTERRASPPSSVQLKREPHHNTYSRKAQADKTSVPLKGSSILKTVTKVKREPEETINEEFLDENFHLPEEEFESDYEEMGAVPGGMKPGRMDEDMPSDNDSHSEDGSLYDELPSSESDDAEDWFQLDIRAEKAGDYLPLLGPKAKTLLLEEKTRVATRLTNLKQSLTALTDSGKKQAEQVRAATMALAELDDMLKAS